MNAYMRLISCVRPKLTDDAMWRTPAISSRPVLNDASAEATTSTIARHCSLTRGPGEQFAAEVPLERGDQFADGRLRHVHFPADRGKAPPFDAAYESGHRR
jgi:hypothetical protein